MLRHLESVSSDHTSTSLQYTAAVAGADSGGKSIDELSKALSQLGPLADMYKTLRDLGEQTDDLLAMRAELASETR